MTERTPLRQVRARVLDVRAEGAYRRLRLAAPGIGDTAAPGQFVAVAIGAVATGAVPSMLLRRCFSLHRAGPAGAAGPEIELVVADAGPGSAWVCAREAGDELDVVGPGGVPFPAPADGGRVVVVGGGYGSAPLIWWAEDLAARGVSVDAVLGAGDAGRLFGEDALRAATGRVEVTTDDGSRGTRGRVTDVLPALLEPGVTVYACGPMAMLRAVAGVAAAHGARAHVTVEEAMACGIGVCMTCVLPARGGDGQTRMVRSCVEGPTFDAEAVRWDAVLQGPSGRGSVVPGDCVGAPAGGAPAGASR